MAPLCYAFLSEKASHPFSTIWIFLPTRFMLVCPAKIKTIGVVLSQNEAKDRLFCRDPVICQSTHEIHIQPGRQPAMITKATLGLGMRLRSPLFAAEGLCRSQVRVNNYSQLP